ncbi:MAG: tRNA (adenosine(37)-N6)-threonylcarbamoyltransferase complex ATPase subunit type 1 TsaE, partial [Candidatus Omnitrophica bacterium]|nr:tRNA (adenosine(37)-N6)-threonylcarbamoyltransferase complex ATPase subunit type 1 TsaE [Candidatus Omnitrophota bacterium]
MRHHILSKSPKETLAFGEKLSRKLKPGDVVCLFGPLGSGKTVLTKGIAKGFGVKDAAVHSPTFTFLNIYEGKAPLYHFDLYRIEGLKEIEGLGIDDFLYGKGICVIEWAEKLGSLLPKDCLEIKISHKDETSRVLDVFVEGER